nr:exodeoxyribonuclease III [Methylocucumis oryzae]
MKVVLSRQNFGNLSVVSLYLPSGTSGDERQAIKYQYMDRFTPYLQQRGQSGRDVIICGDINIAHKEIDLKNWRSNQKNSGFLPEEREWLTQLFATGLWYDAFRLVNQDAEQYTWWSNRGQAWAKNVGWRIDYHLISASLKDKVLASSIYKEQRFFRSCATYYRLCVIALSLLAMMAVLPADIIA